MKTQKMKKVMIALDYDPTAQKIAETGYALAKSLDAQITLLHVVSEPVYYASREYSPIMGFTGFADAGPEQVNSMEALTSASLSFLEKTKKHLADENIQLVVREGDIAETVAKTAKDLHADMIIMGSHSRKWLENIVMGSTTEEVLKYTDLPIFIVPTKKK